MSEKSIQTSDNQQPWSPPPRASKHHYTYEVDGLDDQPFDLFSNFAPSAPHWIAEEASDDFYSHHDGWEWSWPAVITVFKDGGALGRFIVEIEHEPSFHARPVSS